MYNAKLYEDIIVVTLEDIPYPDAVAEIADFFPCLDRAEWLICLASYENFHYISTRTKDLNASAGLLLASILHSKMA